MTVAKSQVPTLTNTQSRTRILTENVHPNQPAAHMADQAGSKSAEDRGLLTLPLGAAEAFPVWAAEVWSQLSPELNKRAKAVWQLAMTTPPKTLLICAAVALLASFGVMAIALLVTILTLTLKLVAAMFAGIALWQWVRSGAHNVERTLSTVAMPVTVSSQKKTAS